MAAAASSSDIPTTNPISSHSSNPFNTRLGYHVERGTTTRKSADILTSLQQAHSSTGSTCYQIFLSSPRALIPSSIPPTLRRNIKEWIAFHDIHLYSHSSYIINMATPSTDVDKSSLHRNALISELTTAFECGISASVLHTGKSMDYHTPRDNCINFFRRTFEEMDNMPHNKILIETSSGQGSEMFHNLTEFGNFYDEVVQLWSPQYLGICLDTCHVFAAGYQLLENPHQFMQQINDHIGWEHIQLIHLNDSKVPCGKCVDRHENWGHGHISSTLRQQQQLPTLLYELATQAPHLDYILETPDEVNRLEEITYIRQCYEAYVPGR